MGDLIIRISSEGGRICQQVYYEDVKSLLRTIGLHTFIISITYVFALGLTHSPKIKLQRETDLK